MVLLSNSRSRSSAPAPSSRRREAPGRSRRRTGDAPGRTGRRSLEKRLAILRAAGRAFRRHGFAQSGMREIAREAGLSPANLYYYFRGKDELLAFCQDQALDRMLGAAEKVRRNRAGAARRLQDAIRSQVLCMLSDLAGAAAHLEVDALPAASRSRILRKRDRYERSLRRIIAQGMREGSLETRDPVLAARAILGAVNWAARWYDPDGEQAPAEIADFFAELLVRGLRRKRSGGPRP